MLNHIVIRESQVKLETNVNHTVAARVRVVMKLKAEVYGHLRQTQKIFLSVLNNEMWNTVSMYLP